jgi:hypothetical protein
MASRGDVFDVDLALAGTDPSGRTHHAFAVCADEFIAANSKVVLISTTRGSRGQVRPPFGFYFSETLYVHERGRALQMSRPVTPTLLATVPDRDLPQRVGYVTEGFFTGEQCKRGFGAFDALRVQFQLPSRGTLRAKHWEWEFP